MLAVVESDVQRRAAQVVALMTGILEFVELVLADPLKGIADRGTRGIQPPSASATEGTDPSPESDVSGSRLRRDAIRPAECPPS